MTDISPEAQQVLRALRQDQLVLITGPPATGKTRVLQEVGALFTENSGPISKPGAAAPIQDGGSLPAELLPSPDRSNRRTFSMAFNQGTTYRDVWRGLEPKIGAANTFRMSEGVFWKANEFALEDDSTALVEVDELNRGPAVAALGEGVVALEADKRTAADGSFLDTTFTFPLRDDNGDPQAYGVSPHLYVLAAQNDADASIESIDLAWYRRFTPIKLMPDAAALIKLFDLTDLTADLPQGPDDAKAVYAAATRAWNSVNERIIVGRSADFQIGHGVFFRYNEQPPTTPKEALDYVRRGWSRIERHIDEVFYGEIEAMADALRVTATSKHPYKIERELFAEVERPVLVRGSIVADDDSFYELLKTIAEA